jgi:Zn-dependent protease with chaperone function
VDQPQFEALVARMAQLERSSPHMYRWRVYALAMLGFAALLLLVLTLLVLLGFAVEIAIHSPAAIKLVLVIGALLLVVLRAMWVRLQPPEGEPIARHEAPELFALLDRLRGRLNTPPVYRVVVTSEFNAAVTQIPRLGVFGWHRSYLLLGLPLMRCLSADQLEAVLAHELGHLSRGHARIGNWIYRLRLAWYRLDQALEKKPQWGSGAIRSFLHWYAPYFNACSYPLARSNEFQADATAAQLTSPQAAAQALTNTNVLAVYLHERYWPWVHSAARDVPQPAFGPFSGFNAPNATELGTADAERWLAAALAQPTTCIDTHPCLKERLQALGAEAQLALPAPGAAADRLLGERGASLANVFDARWREQVQPSWKQCYEQTQKKRARLTELRAQAASGPLATSDGIERAGLEEEVGEGPACALALRRDLVAKDADSAHALFVLARQLLRQGDESGVGLMESVIQKQPDAIVAGSELLRDYWWRRGDGEQARRWHECAVERSGLLQNAKREREQLRVGDSWLEHGLDASALGALIERLKLIRGLRCAYLVRKRVMHLPDRPLYVLAFSATTFGFTRASRAQEVMDELRKSVEFPGETLILNLGVGNNQHFGREFRALPAARIV